MLGGRWLCLGTGVLLSLIGCGGAAELVLRPPVWDFGAIPSTAPVQLALEVANPGRRGTDVRLISTCPCLTIEPPAFALAGGARAAVRLRYDPAEDEGDVSLQVILRSGEGRSTGRQVLQAFGRVLPGPASGGSVAAGAQEPQLLDAAAHLPQLSFEYFYDPGCKGCEILLVRQMVAAQQQLGVRLRVVRHDVSAAGAREAYLRRLGQLGVEERAYPAVVFGDAVLQGDEEIEREFQKVLQDALGGAGR